MDVPRPAGVARQRRFRNTALLAPFLLITILVVVGHAHAQRNEMPAGYPQSLESDLQALLIRVREGVPSPALLVRLAEAYFDLADDRLKDTAKRLEAYEAGAQAAKRASVRDPAAG
jgi:hypothetical protein